MKMRCRNVFVGFATAILTISCLGFASWGFGKSSDRATNVHFIDIMKFNNGVTLKPGTYRMQVPEDSQRPEVTFSQYGNVVATVKAKVVTEPKKNNETEIDSTTHGNAQLVHEIRPGGWHEALVFGSAHDTGS